MTLARFFNAVALGCSLFIVGVVLTGMVLLPQCDSATHLVGDEHGPALVTLPYDQCLCKGDIRMKLHPIPGRTDAVRVKVRSGFSEWPDKEWIQEREGSVKITTQYSRFDIRFGPMYATDDAVGKLELSVGWVCRR